MLAYITAFGRPASGFLTRLWLDKSLTRAGKEKAETHAIAQKEMLIVSAWPLRRPLSKGSKFATYEALDC